MKGILNSRAFNRKYNYYGDDLGVVYNTQVSIFKVWSPRADSISVILYSAGDGDNKIEEIPMEKAPKGIWKVSVFRDLEGVYYTYRINRGSKSEEVIDPYAKACGVNGKRGMIANLSKTNPAGWAEHTRPSLKRPTDAIIYELNIRDLSVDPNGNMKYKGKYLALTEKGTHTVKGETTGIDHIKELGITHVQLMPCYDYLTVDETKEDFSEYNWGYDPLNYNIPEGSYATDPYHGEVRITEFKKAIMALHENGLGVIMDVVYNHTALGPVSNLNILMPNYYYRTDKEGKFSNGSACGNEIASERFMVRKMIIDSLLYWAKEYKIDGFRFDLMGVLDIETMNQIHEALLAINPDIILYGEGWAGGPCALEEKKRAMKVNAPLFSGVGVFNDDLRDSVKGDVFESEQSGFVNGGNDTEESIKFGIVAATKHPQINYKKVNYSNAPYAKQPGQAINYVSAHDNLTLWDKIEVAFNKEEKDGLTAEELREEKIKMQKLANAIVLTSQGVPFLHAGVEFCRTKYGNENSYNSGDKINQLEWLRKSEFKEVFEYYKGLIELRKKHPAFRMATVKEIARHLRFLEMPTDNMVGYTLNQHAGYDEWEEIIVLFNGNKTNQTVELPVDEKINNGELKWQVVVNEKRAGVEPLDVIEGEKVVVPGRTAMVLVRS